MSTLYPDVRRDVAVGTHMLTQFGLAAGARASLGHVSMRVPGDPTRFVVKGRGYRLDMLALMKPDDLVVCDLDAELVDGPPEIVPCGEVKIHSCIYKARPDVQSVVHVHPKYTTMMSVMGTPLRPMCSEGSLLVVDPLPVYPNSRMITTDQEGTELAGLLGSGPAVLLFGHGAVTAGAGMDQAITAMVNLEHQAEMNYCAVAMGGIDHPSIPRDMALDAAANARVPFELPHFQQAIRKAGMPKYSGAWAAWFERAAAELS